MSLYPAPPCSFKRLHAVTAAIKFHVSGQTVGTPTLVRYSSLQFVNSCTVCFILFNGIPCVSLPGCHRYVAMLRDTRHKPVFESLQSYERMMS